MGLSRDGKVLKRDKTNSNQICKGIQIYYSLGGEIIIDFLLGFKPPSYFLPSVIKEYFI